MENIFRKKINIMKKKITIVQYFWRIVYAHTTAHFIAGLFALIVVNYKDFFATEIMESFMLPVDEPLVALAPVLQIFRGIIIALVLLPLRKTFFEEKNGLMKLGIIIIGFSLFSTIGPTIGSFDGYIYTKIPYMYHITGYPEAVIYVLLFIGILKVSKKYEHKKIVTILPAIIMALIILMGITGYVMAQ
jgi:hypothetical protein